GGDEFALLLEDLTSTTGSLLVAERALNLLTTPFDLAGESVNVSASIGIAQRADATMTADALIQEADEAMYEAKRTGKGRVVRSATEARLLALLTSTPGQEFHTRDLIRRIHGSPRPVQLALEKLLRQGLVESRRVGPLRMWRMDPANPVYPALRDLYARTVGLVAQLRTTLERETGVRYAVVFGSYAR